MAPISKQEIEALREKMDDQRAEIREALADDLGGEAKEYDATTYLRDLAEEPTADGGD